MPSSTSIKPVASARNLGVIFNSNLSFSDHISYISKSCFVHIRDLRRIRNTLDHTTACTIATSLIHSKLDYCNSLFLNLNCQQTNRLQLILNSAARAVTKTPKYNHITHSSSQISPLAENNTTHTIQNSLSLKYKSLQFNHPSSILDLLKNQPTYSTRSSTVVTLQRPSNPSRLKITDRSFYHQAPALWNSLPKHLHALSFFLQHHLLKVSNQLHTLSSHCLPLNSTYNWKPTFSFNPILPILSPLQTDTLDLDSAWFICLSHSSPFFIHQHIIHCVAIFILYIWCNLQECLGFTDSRWDCPDLSNNTILYKYGSYLVCSFH